MRYVLIMIFILTSLMAKSKDSFITDTEYAQHLYENPRGIGCNKCHGLKGEGMVIAAYKHKDKDMTLDAPNIKHLTYASFEYALRHQKSVMPKYFLTDKEIKALYDYLHVAEDKIKVIN